MGARPERDREASDLEVGASGQRVGEEIEGEVRRWLGPALEERTVESFGDTGWRFRQLLKLSRPLGDASRLYLAAWDEVRFEGVCDLADCTED